MLDEMLRSVEVYLRATPQGEFLRTARWGWPIFESLHFTGMSMLLGTVGVFDLRLLGFARRIPIAALHRLIPIGISGFVINAVTGFCFLCATPDRYSVQSAAFYWKVTFIAIAGLNVMIFYARRLPASCSTRRPRRRHRWQLEWRAPFLARVDWRRCPLDGC